MIAIPWFVLQTTGSAAQTGITGFFTILPVVLAGFLGGALIDRMGYKGTSILSDLASGITTALVPIMFFTIGLEFWQLMVLVFGYAYHRGIAFRAGTGTELSDIDIGKPGVPDDYWVRAEKCEFSLLGSGSYNTSQSTPRS